LITALELRLIPVKPVNPKYSISPLKGRVNYSTKIGTLDIETIKMNDNTLLPYAVGFRLIDVSTGIIIHNIFYLTDFLENNSPEIASDIIMKATLQALFEKGRGFTIYVHNLGSFDGMFLIRPITDLLGPSNVIMDQSKEFISIHLKSCHITFKDSFRIFPTSLFTLSNIFNVPITKGTLDHTKINLSNLLSFKEEVLIYLEKDLISLLDTILAATTHLSNKYRIDLSTCFSASSLAIKIFRGNFLKLHIPLLSSFVSSDIRKGFRGGTSRVFNNFGQHLFYYDVNSLYPYCMTIPIPFYYLGRVIPNAIRLDTFFGFINATVTPPLHTTPILPYLNPTEDRISFPTTPFTSIFFSEELKYAVSIGYTIKIHYAYEFSSTYLFNEYVNHFYQLKSQVSGGERYIVKLLLNGLYGYFARSQDLFEAVLADDSTLNEIYNKHPIIDEFEVNDTYSLLLYNPRISLNSSQEIQRTPVLSNVAIASAITAYSIIFINPFLIEKTNPCL